LPEAEEQLRQVEQSLETAQQEAESAQEESRQAHDQLEAIRQQTAAAEAHLAEVQAESHKAEQQLEVLRQDLGRVQQEVDRTADKAKDTKQQASGVAQNLAAQQAAIEPRNRLGLTVIAGVVIAEVLPKSAAAAAGLNRGDVIVSVNSKPVFTGPELRDRVLEVADGQPLAIWVNRGGDLLEKVLALGPHVEGEADGGNRLGVTVEPGVVVDAVMPGSPAEMVGLAPGDVIMAVNATPVLTGEQLRDVVLPLVEGAEVPVHFRRAKEERDVTVHLDATPTAAAPAAQ